MQKWQYLRVVVNIYSERISVNSNEKEVIKYDDAIEFKELFNYLDTLGSQGWEMVNAIHREDVGEEILFFKRRVE